MLQRLFRSKSIASDADDSFIQSLLESQSWQPTNLQQDHLRVLFCQDVGDSNKTILYDSDHLSTTTTTTRSPPPPNTPLARSWNGSQVQNPSRLSLEIGSFKDQRHDWKPSYLRTMPPLSASDQQKYQTRINHRKLDLTGEMIFGTAPLAYKGMNTKIHYYKREKNPQIIISKLFTLNNGQQPQQQQAPPTPLGDSIRRPSFSSVNSDRSFIANSSICEDNTSEQSSDDDHYSTFYHIYPPISALHQSTKRIRKFNMTNMENGSFNPTPLPTTRLSTAESPVRQTSRSVKFAVAFIITLEEKNETLYDFVFSHFALIENRLHQLQAVAFKQLHQYFKNHPSSQQQQPRKRSSTIFLNLNTFQNDAVLNDAANHFKQSFLDLYLTPRIQAPLWLNMSTFPQKKSECENSLIKELMQLIKQFDNKNYNYFISTLLTGVLMHHLSWIHTVAPPDVDSHPGCHHGNYDPLWAQLSDLYGYIGIPSRITRTLVVGLKPAIVKRILYILTYFIRCNEVYENTESMKPSVVSSDSIFSRELDDANYESNKFEDKIVRHLTGDVESIAIPNTTVTMREPTYASSSIDSLNSNRSYPRYFSDHDERPWSPDPFTSSPSSLSLESSPPFVSPSECYYVSMPKSTITHMEPDITQQQQPKQPCNIPERIDRLYAKSYGRSLMASYSNTFKSDFVLMGIPTLPPYSVLASDLKSMLDQFALSDAVSEAACLVIDANNFKCRVLTTMDKVSESQKKQQQQKENWQTVNMSNLIHTMLSRMLQMNSDGNINSEEIINFMEDSLQLVYLYSTMLKDIIHESLDSEKLPTYKEIANLVLDLGLSESDIPLLLNIGSTFDSKIWELLKLNCNF